MENDVVWQLSAIWLQNLSMPNVTRHQECSGGDEAS